MARKPSDFAVAVLVNKAKKDAAKTAPDEEEATADSDADEKPDPEGAASDAEKSAIGDLFAAWDAKDNAAGAAALKAFLQACGYAD